MKPKTMLNIAIAATTVALVSYCAVLLVGDGADSVASAKSETDQGERRVQRGSHGPEPRRRAALSSAPTRPVLGLAEAQADAPDAPLSREARLQKQIDFETAREEAFMAKFEAESVDGDWASQWESQLTSALEGTLGRQTGFSNMTIECRSERCVAQAEWGDYNSATLALGAAADATKGACATSVFMPPPADPSAPYRHAVRFASCQDEPL